MPPGGCASSHSQDRRWASAICSRVIRWSALSLCSAPLRPATQDALDKAELEVPEIEWDLWLHECAMSAHRADEGG